MKKHKSITPQISKLALLATLILGGSIILPVSPTLAQEIEFESDGIEIALDRNERRGYRHYFRDRDRRDGRRWRDPDIRDYWRWIDRGRDYWRDRRDWRYRRNYWRNDRRYHRRFHRDWRDRRDWRYRGDDWKDEWKDRRDDRRDRRDRRDRNRRYWREWRDRD